MKASTSDNFNNALFKEGLDLGGITQSGYYSNAGPTMDELNAKISSCINSELNKDGINIVELIPGKASDTIRCSLSISTPDQTCDTIASLVPATTKHFRSSREQKKI